MKLLFATALILFTSQTFASVDDASTQLQKDGQDYCTIIDGMTQDNLLSHTTAFAIENKIATQLCKRASEKTVLSVFTPIGYSASSDAYDAVAFNFYVLSEAVNRLRNVYASAGVEGSSFWVDLLDNVNTDINLTLLTADSDYGQYLKSQGLTKSDPEFFQHSEKVQTESVLWIRSITSALEN